MRPIGLVKQFHKLSRTIEFDLFGFLNLEILILQNGSSTDFLWKFTFENVFSLDNVEKSDGRGPPVSDSAHAEN